ncbi:hypothetical protein V5O48_011381 [Marasmius crinis-equi]|uniref:Uncharacterized protein n=1 Tax=Marasmius crinis-equi TaxID=585013 RepID=A0ABR3F5S9_9AGAR
MTQHSCTPRDILKISWERALRGKERAEAACKEAEIRAHESERRRFEAEERQIEAGVQHGQAERASKRREMELADQVEALELELIQVKGELVRYKENSEHATVKIPELQVQLVRAQELTAWYRKQQEAANEQVEKWKELSSRVGRTLLEMSSAL